MTARSDSHRPNAPHAARDHAGSAARLDDPVVKVADLIDRPGASRRFALALPLPEDLDLPLVEIDEPLHLRGVLESVVDGVLVRATLSAVAHMDCARCLTDVVAEVQTDVVELFMPIADIEAGDEVEEGYEIREGTLDLDTLLRDALVPAVPYQPLCTAACRGLCAVCGTNRNEAECECVQPTTDSRWAALEALRLPESTSGPEDSGPTAV